MPAFRRWFALGIVSWLVAIMVSACQSSLTTSLDGKQCDASGRCASGYVCDPGSNLCIRPAPSCRNGETVCGGQCVVVSTDPSNCGGCDATCTAPEHGVPGCASSRCNFGCDDGYVPCGTLCVKLSDDVDNCGACGSACPDQVGGVPSCQSGVCGVTCEGSLQSCGGACVELSSDPQRCG